MNGNQARPYPGKDRKLFFENQRRKKELKFTPKIELMFLSTNLKKRTFKIYIWNFLKNKNTPKKVFLSKNFFKNFFLLDTTGWCWLMGNNWIKKNKTSAETRKYVVVLVMIRDIWWWIKFSKKMQKFNMPWGNKKKSSAHSVVSNFFVFVNKKIPKVFTQFLSYLK